MGWSWLCRRIVSHQRHLGDVKRAKQCSWLHLQVFSNPIRVHCGESVEETDTFLYEFEIHKLGSQKRGGKGLTRGKNCVNVDLQMLKRYLTEKYIMKKHMIIK